jgi:hypothetical protein
LPTDTVIPDDKITKYLLVRRPRGDKSVWLESAGYSLEEPEQLAATSARSFSLWTHSLQALTSSATTLKHRVL